MHSAVGYTALHNSCTGPSCICARAPAIAPMYQITVKWIVYIIVVYDVFTLGGPTHAWPTRYIHARTRLASQLARAVARFSASTHLILRSWRLHSVVSSRTHSHSLNTISLCHAQSRQTSRMAVVNTYEA